MKSRLQRDSVYKSVHCQNGMEIGKSSYLSLGAFWQGVKIMAGDVFEAMKEMTTILFPMLKELVFIPEMTDIQDRPMLKVTRPEYPLRPEVVESLLYAYQSTKNTDLLDLGFEILDRLERYTRVECGFANVKNVITMELEDKMESFFIAGLSILLTHSFTETLKYLYLLFTPDSPFNSEAFVFNTEAHPFPTWSHGQLFDTSKPVQDPGVSEGFLAMNDYPGDHLDFVVRGFKRRQCLKQDLDFAKTFKMDQWRSQ